MVGHDVGAVVAQYIAVIYADRLQSLTLLSTAHLKSVGEAIVKYPEQREAVGYFETFQTPLLPEIALSRSGYKRLKEIWTHSTPQAIEDYMKSFSQRGILRGAINTYRHNARSILRAEANPGIIAVPTLFVHGEHDEALLTASAETAANYFSGSYEYVSLDAGHGPIEEAFESTYSLIQDHIERH